MFSITMNEWVTFPFVSACLSVFLIYVAAAVYFVKVLPSLLRCFRFSRVVLKHNFTQEKINV